MGEVLEDPLEAGTTDGTGDPSGATNDDPLDGADGAVDGRLRE